MQAETSGAGLSSRDSGGSQLNQAYRIQSPPNRFFKTYKIFHVLWHENVGSASSVKSGSATSQGRFGEGIHSKPRLMIVIAKLDKHCICVPIRTYSRQGTSKEGLVPGHHAIAYTSPEPPEPLPQEIMEMLPPIRVVARNPAVMLDPESRINFSELHTIQYNWKVRPFGHVHERFHGRFDSLRDGVLRIILPSLQQKGSIPPPTSAPQTSATTATVEAIENARQTKISGSESHPSNSGALHVARGSRIASASKSVDTKGEASGAMQEVKLTQGSSASIERLQIARKAGSRRDSGQHVPSTGQRARTKSTSTRREGDKVALPLDGTATEEGKASTSLQR